MVIGIDGGGTQCRFALCIGARRFDWRGGSANATTDPEGTRRMLHEGLIALAEQAGVARDTLQDVPVFAGLAGVLGDAAGLSQGLPVRNIHIEDDRRTAMTGALGGRDGCVLGIGTGSFFGRRTGGVDRLIGGWGFVLGDEASGAQLGRGLLRAALAVADGMTPASPLTDDITARFGGPAGIVRFAATARPAAFAALAPDIVAAAQDGDRIGQDLMQSGARVIETELAGLGWQPGERICPLGGVAAQYAPYLAPRVAACLSTPEGSALDGALHLARQMARAEGAP